MKLILASESKFKKEILNKVGLKHTSKKGEEAHIHEENPYNYVKKQALKKAESINDNKKVDQIIIGLDTIVLINDKIIEKPTNYEEVKENLRNASNNTTKVVTGYSLINKKTNEIITDYQETLISFNEINEEEIDYYIKNEPDALYVSGFVIETICSNFIKKIEGSYYNILGVPVEKIYLILKSWDITLKDLED